VDIQPVLRDPATAAFFDGAAEGKFLLRKSRATGEVLGPSVEQDSMGNTELEWIRATGRGTVVSWALVPRRTAESGQPRSITIGLVELDEGPWWWTQLVEVAPDALVEGLEVRVIFPKSGNDEAHEYVPVFTPVGGRSEAVRDHSSAE
jgi:uncharacterized protein